MPSTVEKLSPTRVKLTVEIPFADLQPYLDKAYKEIAEQVNIPGFRKGKVPATVIDQRFGRGVVLQEAINEAIPNAYNVAIDQEDRVARVCVCCAAVRSLAKARQRLQEPCMPAILSLMQTNRIRPRRAFGAVQENHHEPDHHSSKLRPRRPDRRHRYQPALEHRTS